MRDAPKEPPQDGPPEAQIVLICVDHSYWMAQGNEYLHPMLAGDEYYPVPVQCFMFEDMLSFRVFAGNEVSFGDLWSINPKIVERLRKQGHLLELQP
jgi:hypothetical protein